MEKKIAFVVSWVPMSKFPPQSEVYIISDESEAEKLYKFLVDSKAVFSAALREIRYT